MKKENHLNLVLMIAIIIILILLILTNYKNTKSNKTEHIQIVEGFTEPKQYHKPRNFELYQINSDVMNFIFEIPSPLIVASQVEEYILIAASYIVDESEGVEDSENTHKHLETIMYRKSPDTLSANNEKLLKTGKLMFTINKPQEYYIDKLELDDNNKKNIFYKFGLMAKYPNTYSIITNFKNVNGGYFDLANNTNYNYSEASSISNCASGSEQVSLTSDVKDFDKNNDPTVSQLKEMLGGFPDSLDIQDLDYNELNDLISKKNNNNINYNLFVDYDKNLENTLTSVNSLL
jgi:hypothetical protein